VYLKLFFLLALPLLVFSQEQKKALLLDEDSIYSQQITEEDLRPYQEDDDFNYQTIDAEESAFQRFVQWLKNALNSFLESIFGVEAAAGIILFLFRILPYVLLGFLIFMLLRFFLKVNSNPIVGKKQAQGEVKISEEEQIIKNENIVALINSAISNGEYRLAIRYYYLLALKHLTVNNRIVWKPQKTNDDYLKELEHTDLKLDFEKITRIYDYIWYGEFEINASRFNTLKTDFEQLNSKLNLT
jgi:hypothetical protein